MKDKPLREQLQTYAHHLIEACRCGSNEDVLNLPKAEADSSSIDKDSKTALIEACERGNESLETQLIKKGAY